MSKKINSKKGKLGVSTVTHKMKKPKPIPCDCYRCKHSNTRQGFLYCTYYDLFSPSRKKCIRYWCVKPPKKNKKKNSGKLPKNQKQKEHVIFRDGKRIVIE